MGDLADNISFIHLDFACYGSQVRVTSCKKSSGKEDGEYSLATARPIVPAIVRTLIRTGQKVPTRTFCFFLTFFILKDCTLEDVFVIRKVIGTPNSRKVVRHDSIWAGIYPTPRQEDLSTIRILVRGPLGKDCVHFIRSAIIKIKEMETASGGTNITKWGSTS